PVDPSRGKADCARRSPREATEDPGSIPGTSTPGRPLSAEGADGGRFGFLLGGATPRPRPEGLRFAPRTPRFVCSCVTGACVGVRAALSAACCAVCAGLCLVFCRVVRRARRVVVPGWAPPVRGERGRGAFRFSVWGCNPQTPP